METLQSPVKGFKMLLVLGTHDRLAARVLFGCAGVPIPVLNIQPCTCKVNDLPDCVTAGGIFE